MSRITRNFLFHLWMVTILCLGLLGNMSFWQTETAWAATTPALPKMKVVAGGNHTLALKEEDKTVWAWGRNKYYQLGDGTNSDRSSYVKAIQVSDAVSIEGGDLSSYVIKSDGTVWAWGNNSGYQLGDGTNSDRATPVQVLGLANVTAVSAGTYHALALQADGTLWAWGDNSDGRLGDGTTTNRSQPVQVMTNVRAVSTDAGGWHSLAVKTDGTVWAWGDNSDGQLGNGTTPNSCTPIQVSGLSNVIAVQAGGGFSLALTSSGTVWAWGDNTYGQLGDGSIVTRSPVPVRVSGLSGITSIAAGIEHSLALKSDGTVWAWGDNQYGQLGDASNINRSTPVQVQGLINVSSISAGNFYSHAVKTDNTIWSWGIGDIGQIGNGATSNTDVPLQTKQFGDVVVIATSPDSTTVTLNYNIHIPISKYAVKRGSTILDCPSLGNDVTCTDTGLTPGTTYTYTVEARDAADVLLDSTSVTIKAGEISPDITLTADQVTVPMGTTFSTYVAISNATDLYAEDVTVNYNPTLFTLVGAEPVGTGLKIYHQDESTPGSVRFIIASQGAQYGINDSAQLLKLTFQANDVEGTDTLTLTNGLVADSQGNEIVPTLGNLAITVIGIVDGDVNGDGRVSLGDLAIAGRHFGMDPASWTHPKSDVNKNNSVEDLDLAQIVEKILLQP